MILECQLNSCQENVVAKIFVMIVNITKILTTEIWNYIVLCFLCNYIKILDLGYIVFSVIKDQS